MAKMKSFNDAYQKGDCYWGAEPNDIVLTALDKFQVKGVKRALDIGGGEGRDTVFLAKRGFDVTLVDKAEEGLKNALKLAKKNKVEIKVVESDVTNYEISREYDIIICNNVLQFLKKEEAYKLLESMKLHTSRGGINIVKAFTYKNPGKKFKFLLSKDELKQVYGDWKILEYKEYLTPSETHGSEPHRHGLAEIIASKK